MFESPQANIYMNNEQQGMGEKERRGKKKTIYLGDKSIMGVGEEQKENLRKTLKFK